MKEALSYLLYDVDQLLQHVSFPLVCDDGRGQVAQDVWGHRLDRIQVSTTPQSHQYGHMLTRLHSCPVEVVAWNHPKW